jgi:hypothetical protein
MLGKLIKYDLLYNWRGFMGLITGLLVFGLSGFLMSEIGNMNFDDMSFWQRVMAIANILIWVAIGVAGVQCIVSIIQGYRRTVFSRWGYLTLSLPTTPAYVLAAKLVTALIWLNIIIIMASGSMLLFAYALDPDAYNASFDFLKTWDFYAVYFIINLWVLTLAAVAFLGITTANASIHGRRLGVWCGLACFAVFVTIWGVTMYYGHRPFVGDAILLTLRHFWFVHSALFLAGAFYLNVWLMKRKVCL